MIYEKTNPAFCKRKFTALLRAGVIQGILLILLGATDAILAGIFVGEEGVASIAVTGPVASIISFVVMLFVEGCHIIYPERIGKFDKEGADHYFSTALTAAVILSALFLVLIMCFGQYYFDLYNISGKTLQYSKEYFRFYKYVYVLTPFVNFIGQMVYCDGDVKVNMAGTVLYFALNVVLSIVGAITMGMAGIGLGTLLGGIACLAVNCIHFFKPDCSLKYRFYFSVSKQLEMIRYSVKETSYLLFSGINGIIITRLFCDRFGSEYLTVNMAVGFALGMTGLFGCISEAMLPVMNIYRGEGNRNGVEKILRVTFRTIIAMGLLLSAVVFIAAPVFPRVYSITTPELVSASVNGIRITSLSFLFVSFMTVLPVYYNALGKVFMSTLVSRLKDSVFYILFAVLFGSLFGLNGVWTGMMLSPAAAAAVLFLILRVKYGKGNMLLLPDNSRAVESWDLLLSVESVMELRSRLKEFLHQNGISGKPLVKAAFLVEEIYMLVIENNDENQNIMAELTVFASDDVELIFRDDGKIFDITDKDAKLTSFRSYIVSAFEHSLQRTEHATSLSFNRSRFRIPVKATQAEG